MKILVKATDQDPEGKRPRSFSYIPLTLKGGREYEVPQQIAEAYARLMLQHGDATSVGDLQASAGFSGKLSRDIRLKAHAGQTAKIEPAKQVEDERDSGKSRGSISEEEK